MSKEKTVENVVEVTELEELQNVGFEVNRYPDHYLTRLIEEANKMGFRGEEVTAVELVENFGTKRKYIKLLKNDA